MIILFLLGSTKLSGGNLVIFRHALELSKNNDVYLTAINGYDEKDLDYFSDAKKLHFIPEDEAQKKNYDIAISTWCLTALELIKYKANHYAYFVQAIESRFVETNDDNKEFINKVDMTYYLPFTYITEATWIKKYLKNAYGKDAYLVKNGLDKKAFSIEGDIISKKQEDAFRVLIEGNLGSYFKNVPKTIELCKRSNADEIWLMTPTDIHNYPGVDRLFSNIENSKTGDVYRSCDVLVKLSYAEGMFGPPLEMFGCGGTAIVYDVTGSEEYIVNDYNGIVIKTGDENAVIDAINDLKNNKEKLIELKKNAKKTAEEWIDWETSSKEFVRVIDDISKHDNDVEEVRNKTRLILNNMGYNPESKLVEENKRLVNQMSELYKNNYIISKNSSTGRILRIKDKLLKKD